MTTLLNKVQRKLFSSNFLFFTNTGLSFGLSGLGDLIQQKIELQKAVSKQKINWSRTVHMSTSFGLTAGVLCHFWYSFLDRSLPGKTLRVVIQKVAVDQVVFSPLCIAACLLVSQGLHSPSSFTSTLSLLGDSLQLGGRLYLAEWCIWPPAQFLNFLLLPPHLRVAYDNLVSLGYDCYTSHLVHSKDLSLKLDTYPHSKYYRGDFDLNLDEE